jgi:hypothetical protein
MRIALVDLFPFSEQPSWKKAADLGDDLKLEELILVSSVCRWRRGKICTDQFGVHRPLDIRRSVVGKLFLGCCSIEITL